MSAPRTVSECDDATIRDALERFLTGAGAVRTYARGHVDWNEQRRELYSYGSHFPLVRFVPRALTGRRPLLVINGDEWRGGRGWNPSRTPDHQATVRAIAAELADTVDSCIIPFSAIAGAGIEIDSVRPIHVRPDATWTERRESFERDDMPHHERTVWVQVEHSADTLEQVPHNYRNVWSADGWGPMDPGPDGRYHWTGGESRPVSPDPDGRFRWTEHFHRLGDCLFSAVQPETYWRDAAPFERTRSSARGSVELADFPELRRYCDAAPDHLHETGPSGACIHCGRPCRAQVTVRPRRRFLSSFDMNERPPLYFLARVPRGAGDTVESALDSLAPRAVHAAYARGSDVRRQGDIFLLETPLTEADLIGRGAVFARLTQWTRDARARFGETGFVPPLTAAERRAERAYARRLFRKRYPELWRLHDHSGFGRPSTGPRKRRDAHRRVIELEAKVGAARESLRRELARPYCQVARSRYLYRPIVHASRDAYAYRVKRAREELERFEGLLRYARSARATDRDAYRTRYGGNAAALWVQCRQTAAERFRPHEYESAAIAKRRAAVRRAVSIYGTAHTATRVARVDGAVYVCGTVRHVPELEPNRRGAPDHRPITLPDGRWYLAVRNAVPRQTARRRRVAR